MAGGNLRLLHVNKIREYRARVQTVGVIYDIDDEFGEIYETPIVPAAEKNDEALDRKGYWSIPMENSSKHLTAFRTHRGQYQWNVLPFGLRNAAATYQRAMSKVVQTISDFACVYIDDLAIFSDTWEEHLNHLEEVFKRLEHFNFSVNLGKCEFARQKVKYLRHVIGSGRHSPDKERIKAIQNLQAPTTKKQLRSALGLCLCNFYRQYIPNFAKIALPLTELTKKKVPNEIPWSKEAENAFKELKTALCQLDGEDNIHPIAFGSQKLNPSQQKWSTIEREAYAIIWALKRFETLLCGAKIFLLTNHNPLVFLTSAASQCPRLQSQKKAINALLAEPSFQPSSLDFLLGGSQESPNCKPFSLRDYKEVSKEEIDKVEQLCQLLHSKYDIAQQNRGLEEIDDDLVCTICYANPKSACFYPCQHQSCRNCISLHLLSHKECFFCKSVIEFIKPTQQEKK
ncbi:retrovirus-related Pol polyprotein from transposon 17.6 [Trichonephila clavipes]|nr:retrovirus-related Pol polyprotein from transposon 17.6 [Trichonephila clavipes]